MGVSQATQGKPTMGNGDVLGAPLARKQKGMLSFPGRSEIPLPHNDITLASARETSTPKNDLAQEASVPMGLSSSQETGGNSKMDLIMDPLNQMYFN